MELHMATTRKPTEPTKPELPAPTFSLEQLNKLVAEGIAKAMAERDAEQAAAKPANSKAAQVDMQVIRSFKRAGFGVVKPRIDTKTFNIWLAEGMRPLEGSKAIKAGGLRLFHRSQCRAITEAEKAERLAQAKSAIDRHVGAAVIPITGANPQ
jgi:hypothetical protein